MGRTLPPPQSSAGEIGLESLLPRCPGCGVGDLFRIEVARSGSDTRRIVYCAGVYDRDRRRFVRRSCGYSGPEPTASEGLPEVRPAGALAAREVS